MTLYLERECEWCHKRKPISEPIYDEQWRHVKTKQPEGWRRVDNPLGHGMIDLCKECSDRYKRKAEEYQEAKDELYKQMMRDAIPRGPRLERDEEMRKKERQRKADGQTA